MYSYVLVASCDPSLPLTEASSSASSSDEEVREAFENYLPPVLPALTVGSALWSPAERPIRVPPSGCRKRVPKYFAQMASTDTIERPRLDFNKMQSRRLAMVRAELYIAPVAGSLSVAV